MHAHLLLLRRNAWALTASVCLLLHFLCSDQQYKLKVTVDLVNGLGMDDLYCRIPLVVHPKLSATMQPAYAELTRDVVVCCCFNKGQCKVCCCLHGVCGSATLRRCPFAMCSLLLCSSYC